MAHDPFPRVARTSGQIASVSRSPAEDLTDERLLKMRRSLDPRCANRVYVERYQQKIADSKACVSLPTVKGWSE
jgi:hypothetical protein